MIKAAPKAITWELIKKAASHKLATICLAADIKPLYERRLAFEFSEVEKQGAHRFWEDVVAQKRTFEANPAGLLLPWLLSRLRGVANVDPIATAAEPPVCTTRYSEIKDLASKLGHLPRGIRQDDDKPDIDIDCLPEARDEIKEHACERFGREKVASVGTWQTFLFKQALVDCYGALGMAPIIRTTEDGAEEPKSKARNRAQEVTKLLPEDVDEMREGGLGVCKGRVTDDDGQERDCGFKHDGLVCPQCGSQDTETPTLGRVISENEPLRQFIDEHEDHRKVVDIAARLVGRIRQQGKHAGAIIIADRDLFGNVPMALDQKTGQWVSIWTEGHNTQLSKFGYTKWDWLGLLTLGYIYDCCRMIEQNHGVSFGDRLQGLDDINPQENQAGSFWVDGVKQKMLLDDPKVLILANERRTDAVFQFDTDLAKRTLGNGVTSFRDLMILNAMGHPGPMQSIPEYVEQRDDIDSKWRIGEHQKIVEALAKTSGVLVFQEQLTRLWQEIAGFTGPEAQEARKAVAKKWKDKLKPVEQKWLTGATPVIGRSSAERWWSKMTTFGRYAFNESHSVAYCLWAHHCLWFKGYYPEEWIASVLGRCGKDKVQRYTEAHRAEGVCFGEFNINRLTIKPTANSGKNAVVDEDGVSKKTVSLGLINLKGVGDRLAEDFGDDPTQPMKTYSSIDDFVAKKGKSRVLLERLIKLGAFRRLHPNAKATWRWYLHAYGSGNINEVEGKSGNQKRFQKLTDLKAWHRQRLLEAGNWTLQAIETERKRQIAEFTRQFPKRKMPKKIAEWQPKPAETAQSIMALYEDDYSLRELLNFEQDYLSFHWHSMCDLYRIDPGKDIAHAKVLSINEDNEQIAAILECVVTDKWAGTTKNGNDYAKLTVSDGIKTAVVLIWESELHQQQKELMQIGAGIRLNVLYDRDRDSYTLARGTTIEKLWTKAAFRALEEGEDPSEQTGLQF